MEALFYISMHKKQGMLIRTYFDPVLIINELKCEASQHPHCNPGQRHAFSATVW